MMMAGSVVAVVCCVGTHTLCARKKIKPKFFRILEEQESVFAD